MAFDSSKFEPDFSTPKSESIRPQIIRSGGGGGTNQSGLSGSVVYVTGGGGGTINGSNDSVGAGGCGGTTAVAIFDESVSGVPVSWADDRITFNGGTEEIHFDTAPADAQLVVESNAAFGFEEPGVDPPDPTVTGVPAADYFLLYGERGHEGLSWNPGVKVPGAGGGSWWGVGPQAVPLLPSESHTDGDTFSDTDTGFGSGASGTANVLANAPTPVGAGAGNGLLLDLRFKIS